MQMTLMDRAITKALSKGPVHMDNFQSALVKAGGKVYRRRDVYGETCGHRNKMVKTGIIEIDWDDEGAVIYSLAADWRKWFA